MKEAETPSQSTLDCVFVLQVPYYTTSIDKIMELEPLNLLDDQAVKKDFLKIMKSYPISSRIPHTSVQCWKFNSSVVL